MSYPKKLLEEGEEVVLDLHPHWRALVLPVAAVPIIVGVASYLAVIAPDGSSTWEPWLRLAILVAAIVALVFTSLLPWLRWVTTNYVVTTRRVVLRDGVLAREGRDVPMARINDVTFQHTAVERLLGSGTLLIESAGERGQVELDDVPRVEEVQHTVYKLMEAEDQRRRYATPPQAPPAPEAPLVER